MLRIEFSDGSKVQMMKLLEEILLDAKFKGTPKMIVTQFCRGKSMSSTMAVDAFGTTASGLKKNVNGQEFYSR